MFYRLLQDGFLFTKADYKRLLSYLSKARKRFYKRWRPDTLADDTRAPLLMERQGHYTLFVRGESFYGARSWLNEVRSGLNCPLDKWMDQDRYVEVWFEAAAMMSQFRHYANESIPLLAFHGDVSIPAKWEAAVRIHRRWKQGKKIVILYYGDLDDKGLEIPKSAERDIVDFVGVLIVRGIVGDHADNATLLDMSTEEFRHFLGDFTFQRIGLNEAHPVEFDIPENPERPGTYQWEALGDAGAQELIEVANRYIDLDVQQEVKDREERIIEQFRYHLEGLELEDTGTCTRDLEGS